MLSGFAYPVAGIGIWLRMGWMRGLATFLAAAIVVVFGLFGLFGLQIAQGAAFEMRRRAQ